MARKGYGKRVDYIAASGTRRAFWSRPGPRRGRLAWRRRRRSGRSAGGTASSTPLGG